MSQLTLEQSLQGIRGIADDEERCRPSTLAAAVPAPHADPKGNYCKCVVCGKRMPKKSGERCDAQTLQLHYFAVDCPHLKQTTREQRVTYAHFCSVDCQTKIKMPPLLDQEVPPTMPDVPSQGGTATQAEVASGLD